MSCGQIALRELGAKIDTYYASEVDKYAIQQTQYNFPDTVQLGDVRNVDARKLGHVEYIRFMDDDKTRCCGNCALCVHTYLGSECGLTDNPVDDNQAACIDYIPED